MRINIFLILVLLQKVGSNRGLQLTCAVIVKYDVLRKQSLCTSQIRDCFPLTVSLQMSCCHWAAELLRRSVASLFKKKCKQVNLFHPLSNVNVF